MLFWLAGATSSYTLGRARRPFHDATAKTTDICYQMDWTWGLMNRTRIHGEE